MHSTFDSSESLIDINSTQVFNFDFFVGLSFKMTFVVVYLIGAREFVAIPEEWVLDLSSANLKNYGTNSVHNFRTFWSAIAGKANLATKPNFALPLAAMYQPTTIGVCYTCRIKKFFGK